MADKKAARLAKLNSSSQGTILIHPPYTSIGDLLRERGEEYPNMSILDAYDFPNRYKDQEKVRDYNIVYNVPKEYEILYPEAGDRTCNWDPQRLCIYVQALHAGLRFPFHDFIPILLASVKIHPCQLVPNAWRAILCFLSLCLGKKIEPTVPLFRKIFQFKNSAQTTLGWVSICQRHGQPHIFNNLSLPDSKPKWKEQFVVLRWKKGDWGTLFRKTFCIVEDGSPEDIELSEKEKEALTELQKDNGQTHYRKILDEFVLKDVGLSRVTDYGNSYSLAFLFLLYVLI